MTKRLVYKKNDLIDRLPKLFLYFNFFLKKILNFYFNGVDFIQVTGLTYPHPMIKTFAQVLSEKIVLPTILLVFWEYMETRANSGCVTSQRISYFCFCHQLTVTLLNISTELSINK